MHGFICEICYKLFDLILWVLLQFNGLNYQQYRKKWIKDDNSVSESS